MSLQFHGGHSGILNLIDIIIADHQLQRRALFEDLHHLPFEGVFPADLLHVQFAIGTFLQPCDEVIASHPDGVLAVTIDHRDTSQFGCVDHTPLATVIVKQSLEVCHEHRPVLTDLDIVVLIVSAILRCGVVSDQRKPL